MKKKQNHIKKVVFILAACLAFVEMAGEIHAASLDPSQQLILEVEKYVEATRELNVAMMMISRIKQDKDPQAEVYHYLEGLIRLAGICEKIQKSWHAIRKQEELLSAGASTEADPIASSGPCANQSSGANELWSRGDWLTEKALEALPELSATAKKTFADSHLKLKIYAVYLVSNACPLKGRNGDSTTCYDPVGVRICCNLKMLVSQMQNRLKKQYKYKNEDLCTNEIDRKTEIMLELTRDIDGLELGDLQHIVRELGGGDLYWAKMVKEEVVAGAGDLAKSGGWDYVNAVKDSFFNSVSSTWDNVTTLGGLLSTKTSSDDFPLPLALVTERGPAAGNLNQALNPELPRGLAILAPKDKKKAPRLIALLEFTDGRAVIPYTLQGHYDLYILIPGYLPLLHKDVNIGAQDQEVTINPVSAGSSKTVPLGLSPDWDPLKESTLQVPPCPPCDEEEDGTRFLIRHTGSFTSKGAMYNIEASAGTEFSLVLPEGETEAEIDVVYSVQHQLQNNSGGSVRIVSISPQSYTLNAVLRWRVQKTTNRDGVDEYEFGAEIIDRETAQIRVVTQDRGDEPMEWNMEGAGNAIDLCFPRTWFQVRQGKDIDEFPFYEKNEFSDSMPQALIGMSQTRPDAPRFDDSNNKSQSTIRVEISGKNRN